MHVATRRLACSVPRAVVRCAGRGLRGPWPAPSPAPAPTAAISIQHGARLYSNDAKQSALNPEVEQQQQQQEEEDVEGHVPGLDAELPPLRHKWRGRPLTIPNSAKSLPIYVDAQTGQSLSVSWNPRGLYVVDEQQVGFYFSVMQLRDGCQCSACVDPSSGQKSFATTSVPPGIKIKQAEAVDGEGVVITTRGNLRRETAHRHEAAEDHTITVPWTWLLNHFSRGTEPVNSRMLQLQRRFGVEHWDAEVIAGKVRRIDYHEYMKGEDAFWDAVRDLVRLGIVFLKNVPRDEQSVVAMTTRLANIRETFYGRTFDVRAKPNAENVAYTSGYLGLHQDLLYLQPPPQIQVLHCMDNSCEGGESLFSDADRVGRMLWQLRNQAPINNLARTNVWYGYDRHGHRYSRARPLLKGNPASDHVYGGVFWSPPFQKPFRGSMDVYRWGIGARIFEELVNDDAAVYRTKMEPGEAVLFDNMRVLHGRTAFDAAGGGSRWLRGAYIAPEDFVSRASYAPESHARSLADRASLWSPSEAERELMKTDWYAQLAGRVEEAQNYITENQILGKRIGRAVAELDEKLQKHQDYFKRLPAAEGKRAKRPRRSAKRDGQE